VSRIVGSTNYASTRAQKAYFDMLCGVLQRKCPRLHRGSPRRAPRVSPATTNPSRPTRQTLWL